MRAGDNVTVEDLRQRLTLEESFALRDLINTPAKRGRDWLTLPNIHELCLTEDERAYLADFYIREARIEATQGFALTVDDARHEAQTLEASEDLTRLAGRVDEVRRELLRGTPAGETPPRGPLTRAEARRLASMLHTHFMRTGQLRPR